MRTFFWLLLGALAGGSLACGSDDGGTGSTSPSDGGQGGVSGGAGGSFPAGGQAGQSGVSGKSGQGGSEAGASGSSAGNGGLAGQGGEAGQAGEGGASGAGAGGASGSSPSGGQAGQAGSAGKGGAVAMEACTKGGEVCDGAQYCDYANNRCNPVGVSGSCKERPLGCTGDYNPVCGCDGKTYSNACEAHVFGVDVADRTDCPAPEGYFPCGHIFCQTGVSYCRWNWSVQPSFADLVECVPIPKSCDDPKTASCDCFNADFFPGACCATPEEGAVQIVYIENGVGQGPNGCETGW